MDDSDAECRECARVSQANICSQRREEGVPLSFQQLQTCSSVVSMSAFEDQFEMPSVSDVDPAAELLAKELVGNRCRFVNDLHIMHCRRSWETWGRISDWGLARLRARCRCRLLRVKI